MIRIPQVRSNLVEGIFYPADKEELKNKIEPLEPQGDLDFLLLPHGSWDLIFPWLQASWNRLTPGGTQFLLLGPQHLEKSQGLSLTANWFFKTPFGQMNLDRRGNEFLRGSSDIFHRDPLPFEEENCLEIFFPLIHHFYPNSRTLAIHCGNMEDQQWQSAGRLLKRWLSKGDWRIIVAGNIGQAGKALENILRGEKTREELLSLGNRENVCGLDCLYLLHKADLLPSKLIPLSPEKKTIMNNVDLYRSWGGRNVP